MFLEDWNNGTGAIRQLPDGGANIACLSPAGRQGNGANLRINLMNIEHRTRNNECRSS